MLMVRCDFCPNEMSGTWDMAVFQGWKELECGLFTPDHKEKPFLSGLACPQCVERLPGAVRSVLLPEDGALSLDESFAPCSLDDVEKAHILKTLEWAKWNKSQAVRFLGIERSTLDRKLEKYNVERPSKSA